MVRGKGHWH